MNKKIIKILLIMIGIMVFINILKISCIAVNSSEIQNDWSKVSIDYYGPTLYIDYIIQSIMAVVLVTLIWKTNSKTIKIISIISFIISIMLINDNTYGYRSYITSIYGLIIYTIITLFLLLNLIKKKINPERRKKICQK